MSDARLREIRTAIEGVTFEMRMLRKLLEKCVKYPDAEEVVEEAQAPVTPIDKLEEVL